MDSSNGPEVPSAKSFDSYQGNDQGRDRSQSIPLTPNMLGDTPGAPEKKAVDFTPAGLCSDRGSTGSTVEAVDTEPAASPAPESEVDIQKENERLLAELEAQKKRADEAEETLKLVTADLENEANLNFSHLDKIKELQEKVEELSSQKQEQALQAKRMSKEFARLAEAKSEMAQLRKDLEKQSADAVEAAQRYLAADDSEEISLLRMDLERRARTIDNALRLQKLAEEGWIECQQRLEYEAERRRRVEGMMRKLLKQVGRSRATSVAVGVKPKSEIPVQHSEAKKPRKSLSKPPRPAPRDSDLTDIASLDGTILHGKSLRGSISSLKELRLSHAIEELPENPFL